MVAPSARGDAPQQSASRVNEIFTFEGTEQLPPSESTRRKKRLRDRGSLGDGATDSPETTCNKETNGRVTTQELRRLIEDLKEVITNQSKVIQEIKADQQAIKSQNVELQKQIHTLQEQLVAAPATKTGTKSWAEIAAAASKI
jgi:FtsZ-binding cell division protein ZapB